MAEQKQDSARAIGRRKAAAARVRITPGKGAITVNGKPLKEYFPILILQQSVAAPLATVSKETDLDVSVRVIGGGVRGQADAVRHGIARALIKWNEDFRPALKAEGFLTRDARVKERKKPGQYKARRGRQWRKR